MLLTAITRLLGNLSSNSLQMHFYEKCIRIKVVLLIESFQVVVPKFGTDVFFGPHGTQTKYFGAKLIFYISDSEPAENFTFKYVFF